MASGPMVSGLTTMPDSYFLTCRTCAAWPSTSKLRWLTAVDSMAGRRIKAFASHAQAFWDLSEDNPVSAALARITRRRAVLADRLDHLPVPAVLPLHMHRNDRMRRGHQQQDVENQPENRAKHDQDQVEDRRKRLSVQEQPERRQQSGQQVNHRKPLIIARFGHLARCIPASRRI